MTSAAAAAAASAASVDRTSAAFLQRKDQLTANLADVRGRVQTALTKSPDRVQTVRFVAVSKTKTVEDILAAYECGQRDFGENYVQELVEKAPLLPQDIAWRFIGHLQSNKAKTVAAIPNLAAIETIDTVKLAGVVNKALAAVQRVQPLDVFAQVNTSREESKHGVLPEQCLDLVRYIRTECPHLRLRGLMTIGEYGNSVVVAHNDLANPNPDFAALVACRSAVTAALNEPEDSLELSMGMSHDFEHAIEMGSTNVRVGSSVFGAREYETGKSPLDIHQQRAR